MINNTIQHEKNKPTIDFFPISTFYNQDKCFLVFVLVYCNISWGLFMTKRSPSVEQTFSMNTL